MARIRSGPTKYLRDPLHKVGFPSCFAEKSPSDEMGKPRSCHSFNRAEASWHPFVVTTMNPSPLPME